MDTMEQVMGQSFCHPCLPHDDDDVNKDQLCGAGGIRVELGESMPSVLEKQEKTGTAVENLLCLALRTRQTATPCGRMKHTLG